MDIITNASPSTALLTDQYELTMLQTALQKGRAHKKATFEVFARSLRDQPFGIVAGLQRVLDAIDKFTFTPEQLDFLTQNQIVNKQTIQYLRKFRFRGTINAIPEGSNYLPNVPVLTVTGTYAEAILLETVILSIINHDSAIATKAARIVQAANGKNLMEMGSRRTHDQAAVAAARAAYIGGFDTTSNLAAGYIYHIPTRGTAAHAATLSYTGQDGEAESFRDQIESLGLSTTLLIDTYNIENGIRTAVAVANEYGATGPGAIRIDSGDLYDESVAARELLDKLGATKTRIVVSGDLDENLIGSLESRNAPIDGYGVGTKLVSGLTAPGFVYKLVSIETRPGTNEMVPVEKKAEGKSTVGGRKTVWNLYAPDGTLKATHIVPDGYTLQNPDKLTATITNREVVSDGIRLYPSNTKDARFHRQSQLQATPDGTENVAVVREGM